MNTTYGDYLSCQIVWGQFGIIRCTLKDIPRHSVFQITIPTMLAGFPQTVVEAWDSGGGRLLRFGDLPNFTRLMYFEDTPSLIVTLLLVIKSTLFHLEKSSSRPLGLF